MHTTARLTRVLRNLRSTPLISASIIACAALGIAGTTTVLSLVRSVLIAPLPFPDADRLFRIWSAEPGLEQRSDVSYPDFRELRTAEAFDSLEGAARTRLIALSRVGADRLRGESVTPGYFALIGLRPQLGRLFATDEYDPAAPRVILISDRLWRTTYGARADILDQVIQARSVIDDGSAAFQSYRILGVLPPGFDGSVDPDVSDFWLPIEHYAPSRGLETRHRRVMWTLARLREGATQAEAQTQVAAIGERLAREFPDTNGRLSARIERVGDNWRGELERGLKLLLAASALLLLVACADVAALLLARTSRRQSELAVRSALGASPGRLFRELLAESLTLAAIGGVGGVLLAAWAVDVYVAKVPLGLPSYVQISMDLRVVAMGIGLIGLSGILFGAGPALLAARTNPALRLRESGRGQTSGPRQGRVGRALIAAEVALSFVLLTGAALLVRSYASLTNQDLGYRVDHVLRLAVTLDSSEFREPDLRRQFVHSVRERLGSHPGVTRVSVASDSVLPPWNSDRRAIQQSADSSEDVQAQQLSIDEDFLEVLDIRLLAGRNLRLSDDENAPAVALVSQSLAASLGTKDPSEIVGQTLRFRDAPTPIQIVGVVEDVRFHGPLSTRAERNEVYLSSYQTAGAVNSIAVLTSVPPGSLIEPLRKEIAALAPTSPMHWISTMEEEIGTILTQPRLHATLLSVYSATAFLLAVLGLYGVLAHQVASRTNELGIRLVLGAKPRDVLWLVLGQGLRIVIAGLVAGLAITWMAADVLSSLLHGIGPHDGVSLLVVGAALTAVAAIASLVPARQATRVDPMVALRQ